MPVTTLVPGPSPVGDTDEELVARAKRGDEFAKNELIRHNAVLLKMKSRAYANAPIPTAAIEGEAMKLLLYAIEQFKPSAGVKFKTFLEQVLKGLYRYTAQNKNVARIPEHQVLQISRFNNVKSILRARKDREATPDELAEELGWSPAQVVKMETVLNRRAIASSGIESLHEVERLKDRMEEVLEFEYFGLSPEEKLVFNYSLGRHGKNKISDVPGIARASGLTTDRVYAVKRDLARRISARI